MITLSRLFIWPVKSMRGLQLSYAQAQASGLAFDRNFMLTDAEGRFISARQFPELVLFTPALTPDGLWLKAPDSSRALIRFTDFHPRPFSTEVWGNHFTSLVAPAEINNWLSSFFPHAVQLRWTGQAMTRRVKRWPQTPLGFADGYPYLLINIASLRDLQQRCPASLCAEQFRPNLVVDGASPWEEDGWSQIRIGEVLFDMAKPCGRCIMTTVDPTYGDKHGAAEPLSTLQRFRTAADGSGDVDFGLNLIATNSGILQAGDSVEIIDRQAARHYGAATANTTMPIATGHITTTFVTINWQGKTFTGNTQQILLEQLEMQGIHVPYSCRAGICGSCKVRLIAGKVKALTQEAVRDDGTILACSCIPAGDITLI